MADTAYPDGPVYVVGDGVSTVLWESIGVDRSATATLTPFVTVSGSEDASRDSDIPPAHKLALAVLSGDTGAALLLADLVQEQYTGRESELQAELKRRVDAEVKVAVKEERERCSHEATRLFDYLMLSPGLASDSAAGRAVLQVVNNIRAG